jgi:pectate lyase
MELMRPEQAWKSVPGKLSLGWLAALSLLSGPGLAQGLPVIPGAAGFGIETPAGRGGKIYRVTNLNASGAGSLEECISASGARVCVFEVSGIIELTSDLKINNPFITIAGQTAPSPGIMIQGAGIAINTTHDVLIQHISIGTGDRVNGPDVKDRDSIKIVGSTHHVIIDHVSMYWSTDETASVWAYAQGVRISDITFSNCIIAEGLNEPSINPTHTSKGLIVGNEAGTAQPANIAIIGNLFAHNLERNPFTTSAFIANNLVYNWAWQAIDIRADYQRFGTAQASVVGNVFDPGEETDTRRPPILLRELDSESRVYVADNDALWLSRENQWSDLVDDAGGTNLGAVRVDSPPLWPTGFRAQDSGAVRSSVLANVGPRPADRSANDQRIIDDVRNGTGRLKNCVGDCRSGDITVPGGWPKLTRNFRALDVPANPNGDDDGDGYTNLEEWLHSHAAAVEGEVARIGEPDVKRPNPPELQ